MSVSAQAIRHEYLRHNKKFPHVWCPGCGNGIVMAALLRAIYRSQMSKDDICLLYTSDAADE